MDLAAHRAAKAHLVAQMQAGQSWHEAAASVGLQTNRPSSYRLLRWVRTEGAVVLDDQRHGHPTKVRQLVREWLAAFCRAAPEATGRTVKTAILARFGLEVSVSQIHRLRAGLGVRRQESGARGKSAERVAGSANLYEGAGSLLLLAAAQEAGVVTALEQALPTGEQATTRLAHTTLATYRQSLLTLLFLGAVGLRRPWDEASLPGRGVGAPDWKATSVWLLPVRMLSRPSGARWGRRGTHGCDFPRWTSTLWASLASVVSRSLYSRRGWPESLADCRSSVTHR